MSTLRVRIFSVQVARGAACRWAWSCTRLIACVGPHDTIIAATGRLLSWRSGNYSRLATDLVAEFRRRWEGAELTPSEAIKLAEGRRRAPRGICWLRAQAAEQHN